MKTVYCNLYIDDELGVEAYIYRGNTKKIPNHFHEYYEIGFIEQGTRLITCQSKEYKVMAGDIVLFNPDDKHSCEADTDDYLDYRCIHVPSTILEGILQEYYGVKTLPCFPSAFYNNDTLYCLLKDLHQMILCEKKGLEKEEHLLLFLHELLINVSSFGVPKKEVSVTSDAVSEACDFIERHFSQDISLDMLCEIAGFSKYHFIRSFTQIKGISPYSYISALRVKRAQELLRANMPLCEIALELGYSHQSHFTNAFKKTVGMTPKQYADIYTKKMKT